jgi:hypothetical protein
MRLNKLLLALAAIAMFTFSSCQKEESIAMTEAPVSEAVMAKIEKLGFNIQAQGVQRVEGGYIVEGDIMIDDHILDASFEEIALRVGDEEQYRTTNLVGGLPRTIRVGITTSLPTSYVTALDEAIRRFNAESLRLKFQRVSSSPNITFSPAPSGATYLASAGFPSGGNPYNRVLMNVSALGTNPGTNYLATVMAHEMGHCIGFRHTDYMSRQYSCGGSAFNEGASSVGAIHIPGTPTGPDPNSWMLACIGRGSNRYFNANDKTALRYLYR